MSTEPDEAGQSPNTLATDAEADAVLNAQAEGAADPQIEEARRLYVQTGNPLWVWRAISICLGSAEHFENVRRDLPLWVIGYIKQAAGEIMDIGDFRDPRSRPRKDDFTDWAEYQEKLFQWKQQPRLSLKTATERTLNALKFVTGSGVNEIKTYATSRENMHYAFVDFFPGERNGLIEEIKLRESIGKKGALARIAKGRKLNPSLKKPESDA